MMIDTKLTYPTWLKQQLAEAEERHRKLAAAMEMQAEFEAAQPEPDLPAPQSEPYDAAPPAPPLPEGWVGLTSLDIDQTGFRELRQEDQLLRLAQAAGRLHVVETGQWLVDNGYSTTRPPR